MTWTIAVIGRPNVGKSTLFNRLTQKQEALVHDLPGVTRDRREGIGKLSELKFKLIDTAGVEGVLDSKLKTDIQKQTQMALEQANIGLLLIDGRVGLTPLDKSLAQWVRTLDTKIILLVNKCESRETKASVMEAFSLGLGNPIAISGAHGLGLNDLYDAVKEIFGDLQSLQRNMPSKIDSESCINQKALSLAVVGRPNAGKSTLVNKLLGKNRMLVGPDPGVTRDSISILFSLHGRQVRIIDTAGMRKKSKIKERLEYLSVGDTLQSIRFAEVVIVLLEPDKALDKQDLAIARHVIEEGRALVLAMNKWDIAKGKKIILENTGAKLEHSLPQVRGIKILPISGKTGYGLEKLKLSIFKAHDLWNKRIPTSALNRWLIAMTEAHPPPLVSSHRRIRLRYITQAKTRPPTFILFSNVSIGLPASYTRYLINGLRECFQMPSTPIRINIRKGKNPYIKT